MASTVSGKGIDHYKWHRLLSGKASTVKNGIACLRKGKLRRRRQLHVGSPGAVMRNKPRSSLNRSTAAASRSKVLVLKLPNCITSTTFSFAVPDAIRAQLYMHLCGVPAKEKQ